MANLDAALVQQFLNVPVTQGKTVVEPDGVLNDGHRESVAVGFRVCHCGSAYPNPIKATQPTKLLALALFRLAISWLQATLLEK
ncbi:hypothetical protein GCM10022631_07350 [Deinococcus rubellus]|uniref:hypothetical protein n=1 Tax=Deinococcus rubellus TaxID=1889240 RepID=UPI0031E66244